MNKADKVLEVFMDSLFRDEELVDGKPTLEPVIAKGVLHPAGFHPARIVAHRAEIEELLSDFDDSFYSDGGGSMSFLNFCVTKDGNQWGEHMTMNQLCQLGEAVGVVSYPIPRELWNALPGGMPYIRIKRPA